MVQASHILIDTKSRNEAEALKKAERVLASEIKKGDVEFEQAAKNYSARQVEQNGGIT